MAAEVGGGLRAGRGRRLPAASSTSCRGSTGCEMRDFIDRNIDSPLDLLRPYAGPAGRARRLPPARPEGRASTCTTSGPQRVFSFQAMYAGLSPYDALAIYAVIALHGLGRRRLLPARRHARRAAGAGRRGREARRRRPLRRRRSTRVELRGDRAVAVHTVGGERIACDAVVLNPDLPVARRDLLGASRAARRLRYSPSCFLLLAGSTRGLPGAGAPHDLTSATPGERCSTRSSAAG